MGKDFYADQEATLNDEHLRLTSVRVTILTDEQISKMRANRPDARINATLEVAWEPLSFNIEGGQRGNRVVDWIPMTYKYGVDVDKDGVARPDAIEAIRMQGLDGIPSDVLLSVPRPSAKPESQRRYYERWMVKSRAAGLRLTKNEGERSDLPVGQIYSPDEGEIFHVEEGQDEFPQWNPDLGVRGRWDQTDPIAKWVRYPVEKAPGYAIPDQPRIIVVKVTEDNTATAAPTAAASGSPQVAQVVAALNAAGLIGQPVEKFGSRELSMRVVQGAIAESAEAAILGHSEIQSAIDAGEFLEYLVEMGAVDVSNGTLEVA